VKCPECGNRLVTIPVMKVVNETHICKKCKSKWVIVFVDDLEAEI
jgi:hypothetical protein